MIFVDALTGLLLLAAALALTADFGIGPARRRAMLARHRAWSDGLSQANYFQILMRAATGPCGAKGSDGAPRFDWVRAGLCGFLLPAGIGAVFLGAGAVFYTPVPHAVIDRALSYFALPGIGLATVSMVIGSRLLVGIARADTFLSWAVRVFLLVATVALLWALLMHLGLWLEWREKATPTAFGTEWFYAEAYMEYVREPGGLLVPLTAALIVSLPVFFYTIRAGSLAACKGLHVVLAPACAWVLARFVGARTGSFAAAAAAVAAFAGLFRWALGGF